MWRSPDAIQNAVELQVQHRDLFEAMAEIDALGHRTLFRVCEDLPIRQDSDLVVIALTRRTTMLFTGVRHLLEGSLVEPAKLPARALFEFHVALRYLLFGGRRSVDAQTRSNPVKSEARARYYYVAGERQLIYNRQAILDGHWGGAALSRNERRRMAYEIQSEIKRLDRLYPLQSARFGKYQCLARPRSKRHYHDRLKWYSFGFKPGRINSLQRLAERMAMRPQYELLYSAFSGVAHPAGVRHDVTISRPSFGKLQVDVLHPHLAEGLEFLVFAICNWQQLNLNWIARTFVPTSVVDAREVFVKTRKALAGVNPGSPEGFL